MIKELSELNKEKQKFEPNSFYKILFFIVKKLKMTDLEILLMT